MLATTILDYILHVDNYLKEAGPYIPIIVGLIVFAESGILLGFFLPGDSLLLAAGVIAAEGSTNLFILLLVSLITAIAGDQFGFYWGKIFGKKIIEKEKFKIIKKEHITKAHEFFEHHGKKSIVLARFIPIVRTFVPFTAGVAKMNYKDFIKFNIIGGTIWSIGVTLLGFFIGKTFGDKLDKYLLLIIIFVILLSFVPVLIEYIRSKKKNEK